MGALEGKVALITGSSRGLGLAIAQAYAREGAAVVLAARTVEAVEQAVRDLRQTGAQASGIPCNVGEHAQVEALADHAVETLGRIDIWVNNAGVSSAYGPTAAVPWESFENAVRTNIFGTYYGSVTAIRRFLPQRSGKLINLLGRGDREPVRFQNAYASSKSWVRSFTLALAQEYEASGIGIFAFNPGLVDTDLLRQVTAVEGYEARLKPLSMVIRLWANPPEIPAEKAVWLASSATDGKTGLTVRILGRRQMMSGLAREVWRLLRRAPAPDTSLKITSVPSAIRERQPQ